MAGFKDVEIEIELYPSESPSYETYSHWITCESETNWNDFLREIRENEDFFYEHENWRSFLDSPVKEIREPRTRIGI